MLRALSIENIAVAKKLNIEFDRGFSVLTGETGAGKSIIIDSISLLLGAKAQRDLVRTGEASASVTAIFADCMTAGEFTADENGEITVTRTITSDGRSTARINGKSVPLSALRECGGALLALHGQNETVALYDKNEPIRLLDAYAGVEKELSAYSEFYQKLTETKSRISELEKSLSDKSMMIDILKYQIAEIDKAKLSDPGEEEKLEKLRVKLKSIEQVAKSANLVYRALAPSEKGASAAYLLERAEAAMRLLSGVMDGADEMANRLDEYRIEVIDMAEQARDLIDGEDMSDPDKKLDRIETRLAQISRLKKKYGADITEIKAFRDSAAKKLSDLEEGDLKIDELTAEYKKYAKTALEAASKLTEKRREAGKRLSAEVMETTAFLDMPKVRFYVEIKPSGEKFTPRGCDDVDFTVVTNPGEEPQSLAKIASGGELSRIMLALKSAEAKKSGAGTVIFDEIDTGVSGGTSERIGIKLSALSEGAQVVCVTHSAQVAAHADHHFLISKKEVGGRAESSVRELSDEERVGELARIIGGIELTDKQYGAARELLLGRKTNK